MKSFQDRLKFIDRRARSLEGGYHPKVRKDGLIDLVPDRKPLRKRVPMKYVIGLLAGVIGYKVFLLIRMGEAGYAAKLASLAQGETVEKIGATLMQIDPVTRMMTDFIAPFVS
ncbi:hypothetical protein ATO6_00585 [Oceanicola sp. 22II-s10i]|uniref:hypothetical protein n=1 Tax=Oceanicola sp. 22II-s10i TaxID=1317116 RepID=UPI000B525DF6|nr:hypothetical protein [Oceanicola sp. 22II-s10i]OWU85485.1 hypothetical protein ATO6_00585 [Oceanicola sp. 22II-s10i]